MTKKRAPRTLRSFIYIGDEERTNRYFGRFRGQCRIILDTLRSKPAGYQWTSREVCQLLEEHPRFRTSTTTWRAANFWLWKFKHFDVVKWVEE